MKLENQVCTIEQAKRLMELGVAQDSVFYHYQEKTPTNPNSTYYGWRQDGMFWELSRTGKPSRVSTNRIHKEYSAFTVAELGAMIGKGTKMAERHWQWLLNCVNSGVSGTVAYNVVALAGFVITELENNHTTAAEVNSRLNSN